MEKNKQLFAEFTGGSQNMKPTDIRSTLPRHPTKKYRTRMRSSIDMIVVHTTNWDCTPKQLAEYDVTPYYVVGGEKIYNHISKSGCPGITYHEGVMKDGTLYTTLDWREISWHAGKHNDRSIGIALYYKSQNSEGKDVYAPETKQLKTLVCRLGTICMILGLRPDRVFGHRELKGTGWFWQKGSKKFRKTCPGMLVNMDQVRIDVAKYMQILLKMNGCYKGEVDGDFGPQSRKALNKWRFK